MQSPSATAQEFLTSLPDSRRTAIAAVREVILTHLPEGYAEGMLYGMLCYFVPIVRLPTKTGVPIGYIALASQKQYMSLYLMARCYRDGVADRFREEYAATGKKLDMGKGCIRFRRLEDLPLDVIAQAVAAVPVEQFVAEYSVAK
ncbi:MAG: DUF1801 domain-containing protein [Fimbriimonas sp.]|nr:DUF1801 domain-containing protein [Fimbriimonas sp.]